MAKEKICGIYMIHNNKSGKIYIGKSEDIYKRWLDHKSDLRNNKHVNVHLQRAWNKYGENSFDFSILEICSKENINELEIYWIQKLDTYKSGYNRTIGGEGTSGYKHSDEAKEKISKAGIGRYYSIETKELLSQHMLSQFKDINFLISFKENIESQKTPIKVYDRNGYIINEYSDIHSAAKNLNLEATNICKVLKNKYKTCGGYTFTYKDENIDKNIIMSRFIKENHKRRGRYSDLYQINNNGQIIKYFKSLKEASDLLNLDSSSIAKVCNGKLKQTKGYKFKYAD